MCDLREHLTNIADNPMKNQICAQIAELESRLHHTTMSAGEEKRVVDEIGKLRRSKKMAAGVDKKGEQAGLTEKRVDDLRTEIKEFDNELNAIKEEQVSCNPLACWRCGAPASQHMPWHVPLPRSTPQIGRCHMQLHQDHTTAQLLIVAAARTSDICDTCEAPERMHLCNSNDMPRPADD